MKDWIPALGMIWIFLTLIAVSLVSLLYRGDESRDTTRKSAHRHRAEAATSGD